MRALPILREELQLIDQEVLDHLDLTRCQRSFGSLLRDVGLKTPNFDQSSLQSARRSNACTVLDPPYAKILLTLVSDPGRVRADDSLHRLERE
jgi:hypothetical protein